MNKIDYLAKYLECLEKEGISAGSEQEAMQMGMDKYQARKLLRKKSGK